MDNVLQRAMFQGQRPQPMQADGTGITSGLADTAEAMEEVGTKIDNAEDYAGVMDALRGDEASIEERRTELAGYVGRKDANKTPDSVLTLLQPTFSILEMAENEAPEGGINMGMMQAPRQQEAMARMAMGEQPVMRQVGSSEEGEDFSNLPKSLPGDPVAFGQTSNLTQTQILENLLGRVPEAKSMESLLPKYEALYADAGKAYELNPYIAGLQLAAAVANAPEGGLISSVLKPETIKAVSDPILEMAKAKGQTDLLARKAAMEAATASASEETKAKQALLTAAVPKMLEKEGLKFQTIGSTMYVIDPDAMRAAAAKGLTYTPMTLDGKVTPNVQAISLGGGQYATWDTTNANATLNIQGTREKDWIKVETKDGDVILYNKADPSDYKTLSEGNGQILGDAEKGFIRIKDGTASLVNIEGYEYPGKDKRTELMKNAERLGELQAKANPTIAETAELKVLTKALVPSEKGEFERVVEQYITDYRTTLESKGDMTQAQIDAKVNEMESSFYKDYITAKTTKPGGQFDPNAARNKASSDSMVAQLDNATQTATKASSLAGKARLVATTSEEGGFRGGSLGAQRLAIAKLAKEFGVSDFVREKLGIQGTLDEFLGGATELGEVQAALGEAIVVDLAGNFPGNLNQTEIDILKTAAVGIGKTPEANELLASALESIASRQTQIAEKLRTVAQENQGLSDFELKLKLDEAEVAINNELNDPEKNPTLGALVQKLDNYKTGSSETAMLERQETDAFKETYYSKYQGTEDEKVAALKADYPTLVATYPNLFAPLPTGASDAQINDYMRRILREMAD